MPDIRRHLIQRQLARFSCGQQQDGLCVMPWLVAQRLLGACGLTQGGYLGEKVGHALNLGFLAYHFSN